MKKIISLILSILIIATSLCTVVATEVKTTVYVYVNDIQTGDEDFWAWIWDENTEGHWVGLDVSGDGYYTVNLSVGQNVVFARIRRAEQPDWSLVWNQSEDIKFTGENNCVVLKYSDTIGGKMSVEWKTIDAVDKNALTSAMREAEKYLYEEADKYTTSSLNVLINAYFNAQDCYESATTQAKVDATTQVLRKAIETLEVEEPENVEKSKYEDVFQQYFEDNVENLDDLDREYKDCYEYYSESNTTEAPDWALVYAFCGKRTKPGVPGGAYVYTVCSDYFLDVFGELSSPYEFAYYIYVPMENKIYTLNEAFDAQLENIDNTFTEYLLENEPYNTNIIGDCDKDRVLTILDATGIQRELARLTVLNDDIAYECNAPYSEILYRLSDVDRDGELSILDATAIQRKLAKLE